MCIAVAAEATAGALELAKISGGEFWGIDGSHHSPEVIVQAIRRASHGEPYLSPPVALKAAAWRMGRNPGGLTRREVEVLRLIGQGLSNKEIATRLGVTERTVETR